MAVTGQGNERDDLEPQEAGQAMDDREAQEFEVLSSMKHDIVGSKESLQGTDAGITDLMRHLNGDRFSEDAGTYLRQREGKKGRQQLGARVLLVFWYLHRNQLAEAKERLAWILKNKKSPSKVFRQMVLLWRSVIDHMEKQEKHAMGKERLLEEREAFADLRRSLTLSEQGKRWLWEDLFRTEGMWLIQQLPDHNSKNNSKCLYVPGLLAKEYHSASLFTEAQILEANYDDIMQELNPFLERANFQQVGGATAATDSNLVVQGRWADVSLFSAGSKNQAVCRELPKLCALLEREAPEVTKNVQGHALLSRMDPGTEIKRHHGSSNSQLTMHFGLRVPQGIGIEVNKRKGRWEQGKVLVFDDSFYHSVWHKGTDADGPRLVLLLRGYHPEWTLEERMGLIMNHNETPWTMEERLAEVEHLSTPAARQRWKARKRLFQHGPSPIFSQQDL